MDVPVRLFARAREIAGRDIITVAMPEGSTIGDLRRRLAEEYPRLAELVKRSALAVEQEFAKDEQPVRGEVTLLPPVSGG
jgi:molybdopterin converting factor small subunit